MKHILTASLIFCGLCPFSSTGQIGVADPITGNASINFYGRVVDQDGTPLVGAKVGVSVLVGYLRSPSALGMRDDKSTLETDANGNFSLIGSSGHSVKIESIDKYGYELSQTTTRLYPYSWAADIFDPDPKNPVLFVLWEKEKKPQWISVDKHFEFIPDGRPYAVDLTEQKITQATNSEGDFQFLLVRPKAVRKADRFDWSISIKAENGNLFKQTDEDYFKMVFCPKDAFTDTYEESHHASDQPSKDWGRSQFYIKMHNGQSYGKLALVWDAVAAANGPKTNEAGIRIQYTINPNGSTLAQ
jgi:hypothetical protein